MKKNLVPLNSLVRYFAVWVALCMVSLTAQASLEEAEKAVRLKMYDKAFVLYSAAANKGDREAQYQLANLYKNGLGVAASSSIARQWLQRSAQKGWPAAQFTLAMELLSSEPEKAADLIDAAAAKGYSSAVLYVEQGLNDGARSGRSGAVTDAQRWFFGARHGQIELLTSLYNTFKHTELEDEVGNTAIFHAVQNDNLVAVNWLLNRGANVDKRNQFGETVLFLAVAKDKADMLKALLARSKNISRKLGNDDNLLHYAVRLGASGAVPLLSQRKALIDQLNKEGYTPRDLAVAMNNEPLASQLASLGSSSNLNWRDGASIAVDGASDAQKPSSLPAGTLVSVKVITQIIANDNAPLLDSVLTQDPSLVNLTLDSDETLVSFAVKNGNAAVVKALIKHRAKIKNSDLYQAASDGSTDMVLALMTAGAKPVSGAKSFNDAIDLAIMERRNTTLEVMLEWLEKSSNLDKGRIFGTYALTAAKFNNAFAFEKFVDYARPDVKDELDRNAIWYSAYNANSQHLKLLLSKGVSLDTPDKHGKTPLYVAIENNCEACLKILLPRSNVNQATTTGQTPLMAAVYRQDNQAVRTLVSGGADITQRNTLGNTALFAAVEVDSSDIVKFLLDAGASSIRKNNNGLSALDIAKQIRSKALEVMQ